MAKPLQLPTIRKLVDELGDVQEQRKLIVAREETLKEALKKYGPGSWDGKVFAAMTYEKARSYLKAELIRMHVDDETIEKCTVHTPYLEVKLQRKSQLRVVQNTG